MLPCSCPFSHALAILLLLGLPGTVQAQWARIGEVPATEVGAVYASGDALYAGTLDAVYSSHDGSTWTPSAPLPEGLDGIWALIEHEGRLFAGSYGGLIESRDGGATWHDYSDGLPRGGQDIADFAISGDFLYVATFGEGVFRRSLTAGPAAWTSYSAGLPRNVDAIFSTENLLIAGGGANGYVFVLDAPSDTWVEHSFVAFDPSGPHMSDFTEISGVLLGGGSHGLFRSVDGGTTWSRYTLGVGILSNVRFALDGSRVYALATRLGGTGSGTYVLLSDDAGLSWHLVEHVPGAYTYSAAVAGGYLYAGRFDGLWARPLVPTATEDPPAAMATVLHPGVPSPFSVSTRLAYELPEATEAEVEVFDALGRRVATLARGMHLPGRHEVMWEPASAPSGSYIVRLTAGGTSTSRLLHRVH